MPIPENERTKMLAVRLCGPRVIARLESIGITKLQDFADRDPDQLEHQVNIAAGRPIWNPSMATLAMTNLITAARDATADRIHGQRGVEPAFAPRRYPAAIGQ